MWSWSAGDCFSSVTSQLVVQDEFCRPRDSNSLPPRSAELGGGTFPLDYTRPPLHYRTMLIYGLAMSLHHFTCIVSSKFWAFPRLPLAFSLSLSFLSFPIFPYLILSYLILSYLILSYLILAYLNLNLNLNLNLILSYLYLIVSYLILFYFFYFILSLLRGGWGERGLNYSTFTSKFHNSLIQYNGHLLTLMSQFRVV